MTKALALALNFVPGAKKNRMRYGRGRVRRDDGIKADEAAIRLLALGKVRGGLPLIPKGTDARVTIVWRVRARRCEVFVEELGPTPPGVTRDAANLPCSILDALQTVAYQNDRQVAELVVRREP
jgi:hypothetical protein